MLKAYAATFMELGRQFSTYGSFVIFEDIVRELPVSEAKIKEFQESLVAQGQSLDELLDKLNQFFEWFEMPASSHLAAFVKKSKSKSRLQIEMFLETVLSELDSKMFLFVPAKLSKYYGQEKLFGDIVFANFPSANDDIYEAGTCLALERGTACVMHLNRALEISLAALAKALDVGPKNDWGTYLRYIEKELDKRAKTSNARSPDEQFYAEAGANFDRLRRAYRNPTMHPEKVYPIDRAEEILVATKSFMVHLAMRISE